MSYLIDTCVISELVRPQPHAAVVEWISRVEEGSLFVSALTLGELHKGVAKLADSQRARRLMLWLDRDIVVRFDGRILPVDVAVARRWGRLVGDAAARGLTLPHHRCTTRGDGPATRAFGRDSQRQGSRALWG